MSECIVAAAIKHPDGEIYALPAPARHHNVIRMMLEDGGRNGANGKNCRNQGFLTSYGHFVGREGAAVIAMNAGQIKVKTGPGHILFSEDIW